MIKAVITASVFLLSWSLFTASADSSDVGEVPCPEKMECVLVDTFTKADVAPEKKKYEVSSLTADGGFFRVVIMQESADGSAAVVTNVTLLHRGRWISYPKDGALPQGRTAYPISIPRYTDELNISLDKGKGARLQVILEREAAGR
jgi:hypothetical protein